MITAESQFQERASCKVVDYASCLPNDAKCVSLRIANSEVPVKNANDVLLWVCKKMMLHRTKQLQTCIKARKVSWIKTSGKGMGQPKQIAYNCFVDLNASGRTALLRASLILQWLSWPSDDAIITFERDSSVTPKPTQRISVTNADSKPTSAQIAVPSPDVGTSKDMAPAESDNARSVSGESTRGISTQTRNSSSSANSFREDIKANYPTGFDFKETSRRLVGERVGKRFGDAEADRLQKDMFQCASGLWLFSDMVISDEALGRMKERAKEFLSEESCFAMDALRSEFDSEMRNIDDGRDFDAFFAKFVAGDVRGIVRGHRDWRACFSENMSEDAGWDVIAERVREVLKDCGDAVSVEDIIAKMPCLVRGVVMRLTKECMEDAVVFEVGGVEYVKLVESYYLPEDFSEVISKFVETTEAAQGVVSVVLLEAELNARYGDGFRISYGLEDDSVFKQVVSKSFIGKSHDWNRDMFTRNGKRGESNVAEVFIKGHPDIFHEEDFFKYALESRGMKNRGMLILTFLRKHCIRVSRDWWMSMDGFETKFGMGEAQYKQVGEILNEIVGNNRFIPISSIGDDVYDRFPRLESEGKEYPWNPYMLTSVAVHKVRNARVVNDDPSSYTVTAMILPYAADKIDDVVEYVLGTFPAGYFTDVDSAFGYLKANNVRLAKTEKLVAKIKAVLGI